MSEGDTILWQLLLQLFLIILNSIFACAEIAVITMNDNRLAKLNAAGDIRAVRLYGLMKQPARFLATIQVGITLAGFLGSAFAAENFSDKLVNWLISTGLNLPASTLDTISVILITLILSYFTLVLGELVPKRIAMKKAERLALAMSWLIYFISKFFAPIAWLLTISTNGILRLIGIDPHSIDEKVTEEEIRMMVDVGSENGAIDPEEKKIIQNVFEFDDKTAEELMTHRTEVSLLWVDDDIEQWDKTIIEKRYSYYPICKESADDIIGVLNAKDYFRIKEKNRENIMKLAVKPIYIVPDSVRADLLFKNMKKSKNHFAIVMDEYGGMSGIITMNDLLEELVGDLNDDVSIIEDPPLIEQIDSHTWSMHGSVSLDMISEQLGVKLPGDDYDSLSDLVFGLLGTVPEDGSMPELEEYGLVIKVVKIKDHRLEKVLVCLSDKPDNKIDNNNR